MLRQILVPDSDMGDSVGIPVYEDPVYEDVICVLFEVVQHHVSRT